MGLPIMESLAEFLQRQFPSNPIQTSLDLINGGQPPDIVVYVRTREPVADASGEVVAEGLILPTQFSTLNK